MKNPKIIDNQANNFVYKELRENIQNGSELSVISGYFTIYAYYEMKKELDKIKDMRFIFTQPSFLENDEKEVKEFFIDNENTVQEQIEKIAGKKLRSGYTLERFLYDFLVLFFEEDLLFLQKLEQRINTIEEEVLRGQCPNFNLRMLYLKKKIAKSYRYYTQLTEVGQELLDNEVDFFEKEDLKLFDRFKDRAARLAGETQLLREYTMQVQDVYQSEISIRQNDVMKILTIVTAIFLPLTLIAGWYGMNFVHMPELTYRYGYPIIIVVSILIVILSLILFKKKKYW